MILSNPSISLLIQHRATSQNIEITFLFSDFHFSIIVISSYRYFIIMNTLEAIKTRRSIRKFINKPVPKDLLKKIVEAGICAPSSMNRQPWRFIVVTNPNAIKTLVIEAKSELLKFLKTDEAKKKYGDAVGRFAKRAEGAGDIIFYNAPSVILVIQTQEAANGQFDHGLATQNMLLAAHDLGLGSVPIGLAVPMNNSGIARKLLKMTKDEKLVIAFSVGYPDESPDDLDRDFDVVSWIE